MKPMSEGRIRVFPIALRHISAGFTAVLVGYTSSIIIVIQAATLAGANEQQIISWLLVLGLSMGISSLAFSWYYKMPILTAWSTPGAALLATVADQYSLSSIIGACITAGVLTTLTGFISPLNRLVRNIPSPLATAMLAAIVLPFCLNAFTAINTAPVAFLLMFGTFIIAKRYFASFAMSGLLIVGILYAIGIGSFDGHTIDLSISQWMWMPPQWDIAAMVNLGIPLYLVAMLSQNLPGVAMLSTYGYQPSIKPLLVGSGMGNIITAPLGGYSLNLAAISAAICMNESVDPDKNQRYKASMAAGGFYLLAGVWASAVVSIFVALPKEVVSILAGLALLGTLLNCIKHAFTDEYYREAALLTFLVTASGISVLGINAVIWGLLIGVLVLGLQKAP